MKVGPLIWILLCLKLTTAQQWTPDAEESRTQLNYQGRDMLHSDSKPEAYFLHFKQNPTDYSYRKQPSKFLLLLRLPEEEKAESAQKIAQVIEGSQSPFSAPQQQKVDDVGFDDDVQSKFKSVSQIKQQEEAPIEQQQSVPWIPSSGTKSAPFDAPVQQSSYGSMSELASPLQQSHYGSGVLSAPKGGGGYRSSGVSAGVKSAAKSADSGGYGGGFGSGKLSAAGGGGYGASAAKAAEGLLSSGGYGGTRGADVLKSDFGTKGGAKSAAVGGGGGYDSSGSLGASLDGGYGGSSGVLGASGGGYGSSGTLGASLGGYGSSGALGASGGGYGSSAALGASGGGYGGSGALGASLGGGYASPVQKAFKSSAIESAAKGLAAPKKSIGDYGGGGVSPRAPSDYMRGVLARAMHQVMKGDAKASLGDYGAKKSAGAPLSSLYGDMSALGLQMGLSGYSPKGVYFSNKESAQSASKCNCEDSQTQSALSGDGYQRAESQQGLINAASISEAETKDESPTYGDESGGDEGKIPVIFIGLPKKKDSPVAAYKR